MDAFLTHQQIIESYKAYLHSFLTIKDKRIRTAVEAAFNQKGFIPEPLIQFNPSFAFRALNQSDFDIQSAYHIQIKSETIG